MLIQCNMFILYITSRYSHFNILFGKPCQRQYELLPSLGVCHMFTFHILIFSSENPRPNELILGRKHLWKVLSKECTFCYEPLSNMVKKSSLKLLGQMNRNLVGSIYGRFSIKIAHFIPICQQTWPPQAILVSLFLIGSFLKRNLSIVVIC